jgi:hypothetical protein
VKAWVFIKEPLGAAPIGVIHQIEEVGFLTGGSGDDSHIRCGRTKKTTPLVLQEYRML